MSNETNLIDMALRGFEELDDKSTAKTLIDRLIKDPKLTNANRLLIVVKNMDNSAIAPQSMKLFIENPHLRNSIFDLILKLSGYDQKFKIINKEVIIDEEKPHKLDDKLFEQLLKSLCEIDEKNLLVKILTKTAFCTSKSIDKYLDTLTKFNDENIRNLAVSSCTTRLIEFSVNIDTLKSVLSHNDPNTKFLAAEGLALAGYDFGIQVLLTGIDMLQNINFRERCVLALGKLASVRALDTLLNLANNEEHALQESAIEALGNMKNTEKSNEIFELLTKFISSEKAGLKSRSLVGLRWFDSPEGWHLIREATKSNDWRVQSKAIELLRYDSNKDEALSRLRELIEDQNRYYYIYTIAESILYLHHNNPLEAYYLFLLTPIQSDVKKLKPNYFEVIEKEGKSEILLKILEKIESEEMINKIKSVILNRKELPIKESLELLPNADNILVDVILQILVRSNTHIPSKDLEFLINEKWEECFDEYNEINDEEIEALKRFIWYCGRVKLVPDMYSKILENKKVRDKSLNISILQALEDCKLDKSMISIIKNIALYDESDLRTLAIKLLEKNSSKELSSIFDEIVDTPQALLQLNFKEILSSKKDTLKNAIKTGLPISSFVEEDISNLVSLLKNPEEDETLTFTVLEILGNLNSEKAEKELDSFSKVKDLKKEFKNFTMKLKRKSERNRNKTTSNEWVEVLS